MSSMSFLDALSQVNQVLLEQPNRTDALRLMAIINFRQNNLALGGSLDNAVVLGDEGLLNPEGLRFPDEFVRHKTLDLFGDLALIGMPLQGHVRVERGGHWLHQRLVEEILASGSSGVAESFLRPAGIARFGDRRIDVTSEGDFIEKGDPVEIVRTSGNRVVVRKKG